MDARVKSGVAVLDNLLGGGLHAGSACMVKGAPGTGKTTLGLQFLNAGLKKGEAALYITFEEFSSSLYRDARAIGIDLTKYEKSGQLRMIFTTPEVFLSMVKKPGGEFDLAILESNIKRAVVDAFNHIEVVSDDPKRMRGLAYFMVNSFRRHNITSLLLQEDRLFPSDFGGLEFGLPYIVDTIIHLKYVELESRVRKALMVLKHRASWHSNEILEYAITDKGYLIGGQYEADHLITGSATPRTSVDGVVHYLSDIGPSMDISVRLIEDTLERMAQTLPAEHYDSEAEFFAAVERGEAGISKLEETPVNRGDGVYATTICPFRSTIKQLSSSNRDAFVSLTEKYKNKYPERTIVHPLCVCHQNARETILKKTHVNGAPIHSETLACKSNVLGTVAFGEKALAEKRLSREDAQSLLGSDVCLYTLLMDRE